MSKKKKKQRIQNIDTQRFILQVGEHIRLDNKSGVDILVTIFPAYHHE
jgi:hypothetical protein